MAYEGKTAVHSHPWGFKRCEFIYRERSVHVGITTLSRPESRTTTMLYKKKNRATVSLLSFSSM